MRVVESYGEFYRVQLDLAVGLVEKNRGVY